MAFLEGKWGAQGLWHTVEWEQKAVSQEGIQEKQWNEDLQAYSIYIYN